MEPVDNGAVGGLKGASLQAVGGRSGSRGDGDGRMRLRGSDANAAAGHGRPRPRDGLDGRMDGRMGGWVGGGTRTRAGRGMQREVEKACSRSTRSTQSGGTPKATGCRHCAVGARRRGSPARWSAGRAARCRTVSGASGAFQRQTRACTSARLLRCAGTEHSSPPCLQEKAPIYDTYLDSSQSCHLGERRSPARFSLPPAHLATWATCKADGARERRREKKKRAKKKPKLNLN